MRFVISCRVDSESHAALQLRQSDVLCSVEVGMLDVIDKADVVRQTLAKHAKKLDESAFNNQVSHVILVSVQLYCS